MGKIELKKSKITFGNVKDGIRLEGPYGGVQIKKEKLSTLKKELESIETKHFALGLEKKIVGFIMQHWFFKAPNIVAHKEPFELGAMCFEDTIAAARDAIYEEIKFKPSAKQTTLEEPKKKKPLKADVKAFG